MKSTDESGRRAARRIICESARRALFRPNADARGPETGPIGHRGTEPDTRLFVSRVATASLAVPPAMPYFGHRRSSYLCNHNVLGQNARRRESMAPFNKARSICVLVWHFCYRHWVLGAGNLVNKLCMRLAGSGDQSPSSLSKARFGHDTLPKCGATYVV
jgi:hypothetical protein